MTHPSLSFEVEQTIASPPKFSVPANEQAPLVDPLDCEICKNPSKGGRKRCCERAICQSCFDIENKKDACSVCNMMFAAFEDVWDPITNEMIHVKTSYSGGYYKAHEKAPQFVPTEDQAFLIQLINTMARSRKNLKVFIHGPACTGKSWIARYIAYQNRVDLQYPKHPEGEVCDLIVLADKSISIVTSLKPPQIIPGVKNEYDAVFRLEERINQ